MPVAIKDALAVRYRTVRAALDAAGLDALVVTHLPNIFYLTGFGGTAAVLVLTRTRALLLTDFRYMTVVADLLAGDGAWPGGELVRVEGAYDEALASVVKELGLRRVGFEGSHVSVNRHRWLTARLHDGPELVSTDGIVEQVRLCKDETEVKILRTAAHLLSEVARDVLRLVQAGPSEHEFAAVIDYKLKSAGFTRPAFDTIVAAGANAALPHARPGARRLQPGDLVLLDFGGVYDGYCVDLTRTVCLGPPDGEMHRVFDAVAQAQRAALAAVKPGVTPASIDAAARDVLRERGLGDAFGHGTGHGLGVEVHEAPHVAPDRRLTASSEPDDEAPIAATDRIEVGMVFTIEPGAYVPGWGGVRLEDDVLVTAGGCEVLTDVPRELAVG